MECKREIRAHRKKRSHQGATLAPALSISPAAKARWYCACAFFQPERGWRAEWRRVRYCCKATRVLLAPLAAVLYVRDARQAASRLPRVLGKFHLAPMEIELFNARKQMWWFLCYSQMLAAELRPWELDAARSFQSDIWSLFASLGVRR